MIAGRVVNVKVSVSQGGFELVRNIVKSNTVVTILDSLISGTAKEQWRTESLLLKLNTGKCRQKRVDSDILRGEPE